MEDDTKLFKFTHLGCNLANYTDNSGDAHFYRDTLSFQR